METKIIAVTAALLMVLMAAGRPKSVHYGRYTHYDSYGYHIKRGHAQVSTDSDSLLITWGNEFMDMRGVECSLSSDNSYWVWKGEDSIGRPCKLIMPTHRGWAILYIRDTKVLRMDEHISGGVER